MPVAVPTIAVSVAVSTIVNAKWFSPGRNRLNSMPGTMSLVCSSAIVVAPGRR